MSRALPLRGRIKQFTGIAAATIVMSSLAVVGISGSAGASVARYQMTTLTYTVNTPSAVNFYLASDPGQTTPYGQSAVILSNPCDGTFTGTGTAYPSGIATPTTIAGYSTGTGTIYFTDSYPVPGQADYVVTVVASINSDGSFASGSWSDNYFAGPQSGTVTAGVPVVAAASSWANHGQYVSANGGGADAAHSCLGMPVKS